MQAGTYRTVQGIRFSNAKTKTVCCEGNTTKLHSQSGITIITKPTEMQHFRIKLKENFSHQRSTARSRKQWVRKQTCHFFIYNVTI
jgi:hypothetical protein